MECALKLTDLWITRLLFDLNYKFISRSFAFSPRTESIYYYSGFSLTFSFRNLRLKVCRGQKRDFKMKKKGIRRGYLSLASLQDKHLTFAEGELKARGEAKPRKAGFFLISDSLQVIGFVYAEPKFFSQTVSVSLEEQGISQAKRVCGQFTEYQRVYFLSNFQNP